MKRYLTIKTATKALLALFLAASQPFLCHLAAEDSIPQVIGPFGGLNNTDNSLVIPASAAQDLLNVDITPGGKSFKKRKGYATAYALGIATSPVHGVHTFYDSNGSIVELFGNDRRLSGSVNGASPTVIVSTATFGATWQCVDSQGFAYCANSSRDALYKTNGVTFSNLPVASTGTMVAVTPERLVTAGFASTPNRIDFSKANDFTTWTIGAAATDPINFTVTAPGSRITHITYAFNRIMWFKDSSFGYIMIGQAAAFSDWQVVTVSPNVGTNDNSSIYWNGILYFRGQDSHIYSFDGSNLQKMTRDLQATISTSQGRRSNSWTNTTAADFNDGSFDSNTFVDTTTTQGQIQTLWPDNFSSFRDGYNSTLTLWKSTTQSNYAQAITTTVASGYLKITSTSASQSYFAIYPTVATPALNLGVTVYFNFSGYFGDHANSAVSLGMFDPTSEFDGSLARIYVVFRSTSLDNVMKIDLHDSEGEVADFTDYGAWNTPFQFALFVDSNRYQMSVNGIKVLEKSGWRIGGTGRLVPVLEFLSNNPCSAGQCGIAIDDFGIVPATFTWVSSVKNAPSISSWDSIDSNYINGIGSHTFSMRSSNTSFNKTDASPAWTNVTIGNYPTISTGSYFQIRDEIRGYSSSSNTAPATLYDITQGWFEGSAEDKSYGTYHQDGLWWSIASGDGVTTNNKILRFDLVNNIWTVYNIPMNGMYVKSQSLYFGGVSDGKIYKFGDVDNDGGSAINAYWKSKDFFGDSPFTDKELAYISVAASGVSNSTATVSYTLNGSSTSSFDFPLMKRDYTFKRVNKNLPAGKVGGIFNIQVGNNAADQPFEIFGIQVGIRPKPWNVEP